MRSDAWPANACRLVHMCVDLVCARRRAGVYLDALTVRNHAPFAAFACSTHYRNLQKRRMFASHWDKQVPHVGYFAYRDIQVRSRSE